MKHITNVSGSKTLSTDSKIIPIRLSSFLKDTLNNVFSSSFPADIFLTLYFAFPIQVQQYAIQQFYIVLNYRLS